VKPHEYKFVVPHELSEVMSIIRGLSTVDEVKVPTWESSGRVLSRDAVVPIDIPPCLSAYDGMP